METTYRSEIEIMDTMGDRIRTLRVERGMSQVAVAKRLDVKPTTYNSWERNATKPKHEKVLEIADFFETTLDYLYGRSNDRHISLDEYKMEKLLENKILRIFGMSEEELSSLSKEEFDRIIDYSKYVIHNHNMEKAKERERNKDAD